MKTLNHKQEASEVMLKPEKPAFFFGANKKKTKLAAAVGTAGCAVIRPVKN